MRSRFKPRRTRPSPDILSGIVPRLAEGRRMDSIDQPLITVVIPVKNAAETIGEQLEALARQDFEGSWEVIVSDNGSTDQLAGEIAVWAERVPRLSLIDSSGTPGAGAARNAGAKVASGRYLVFCDADDHVADDWVTNMHRALSKHPFVSGAIDHDTLNPGHTSGWHFRSHVDSAPLGSRFLPYALTSNMGVWRSAFDEVGGFPDNVAMEGSAAGEDMAVSWKLQLAGYPLHFEPAAVVAYRHRHDLGSLWRQHVAYGYAEAGLYRMFRECGLPRSRLLGAMRDYFQLVLGLYRLVDPRGRGGWIRRAGKRYGRIKGSLANRVFYP